jgi:phage baseplate assembly protein W
MGYIKGTPYPVVSHPKGYLHSESDSVDQLKSNMLSILCTKPGERVFEPAFGLALKVDPNVPLSFRVQQARKTIARALQRWEPRVQIADIKIDVHDNTIVGYNVIFISPVDLKTKESLYVTIL